MYVLCARNFKPMFMDQIRALGYTPIFDEDFSNWDDVVVTIGWKKEWETHLFTSTSKLKWVQSISAGVDTLPLEAFKQRHILVSNASGLHAESIRDHLMGVIYMYTRQLFKATRAQQQQQWELDAPYFRPLTELIVTIVGTGQIGTALAEQLTALGVTVLGINRSGHSKVPFDQTFSLEDLHDVAKKSDMVINILPLTAQTKHLYDATFFATLSSHAAFVNVGRGESVDEHALAQALENETFAFASIDVAKEEPLPCDHVLWQTKNLMITPHISGYTPHFETKFMAIFLENLHSFAKEQRLVRNQVDLDQGY